MNKLKYIIALLVVCVVMMIGADCLMIQVLKKHNSEIGKLKVDMEICRGVRNE